MDVFEAITTRRSVRHFKDDPVSREQIERTVNAGRLAPTSHNQQVWEFVVVTDPARRRQLADLAEHGKFIAEAPACIVVLSKDARRYIEDGSAAVANMLVAATGLGLGSCWVAGHLKPYASQIVAICGAPPDMKLVAMIPVGYPARIPSPAKRPLADVLHWESFGRREQEVPGRTA